MHTFTEKAYIRSKYVNNATNTDALQVIQNPQNRIWAEIEVTREDWVSEALTILQRGKVLATEISEQKLKEK
jgi:hypothetical protein